MTVEVSSYLIRLWRDALPAPTPAPEWHCEVEHIQSGQRWSFETADALIAFITTQTHTPQGIVVNTGTDSGGLVPSQHQNPICPGGKPWPPDAT